MLTYGMECTTYHNWQALPKSAQAVFELAEQESLFLSYEWFETLSQHSLEEDQSLLVVCVKQNETVLAILPMLRCEQGSLSALSNRFTSHYSILLHDQYPKNKIIDCLASGLATLPYQPIRLEPVDANDSNMKLLKAALLKHDFQYQSFLRFYNWTHLVKQQNFKNYISQRPSSLQNIIKRKKSKLKREHDYSITLYQNQNIDRALRDYQSVYQASWKANEFFSNFTPALIQNMADKNHLRLAVLYVDQQAIAAQIWFVLRGTANIYRLVYDEKWKRYSPGTILTEHLMEYVIEEDHVEKIDFLTGNEKYKQDWMTIQRKRIGVIFTIKKQETSFITRSVNKLRTLFQNPS